MASISEEKVKIPLSSLEKGISTFRLETCLPGVQLENGCQISGTITIEIDSTKMGEDFLLKIKVNCPSEMICDRCAADFNQKLEGEIQVLFTLDKEKVKDALGDEVKYIAPRDQEIDLTQDILDAIFLSVPAKKLCRKECKGLCAQCGTNWNEDTCNCSNAEVDPRWKALQDLNLNE